jgi:hypothetical protein
MKILITIIGVLSLLANSRAQNYNFNGKISREVLDNYLDRSITMQDQSDIEGSQMLTEVERLKNITMLNDIGAKFVGRIAGWWENGYGQVNHDNFFSKCSLNVANIKANDPTVICQAAVFEYVSVTVTTFNIPAYVFQDFNLPIQNRTFNYLAMLYPAPASQYKFDGGGEMTEMDRAKIPDITQLETQLWFYYMATRYISVGCEAIHFGQAGIMNRRDVGNQKWWELLKKVRLYARSRNRGVVICDAHVPCGGMYYEPKIDMSQTEWQTYCPTYQHDGQLLYDFHSMWIGWKESSPCTDSYQPAIFGIDQNSGLHGRSIGGINPQGWSCVRNPYLVEFDNCCVGSAVGCNYNTNEDYLLWGWDDISWFALQPEAKRNEILKYAYYKTKCIDLNGHLEMPGMRGVTPGNGIPIWKYRANTGIQNQQITIKNIWNGAYEGDNKWIHHNFTNEKVVNQPTIPHLSSSLVFVGSNKMYYIANDGFIHGYIKDIDSDTWRTVSPSYSAQIYGGGDVINQVKAKSDIAVSPDGKTILYIGVDGFIHGFNELSGWNYSYFDFVKQPMIDQKIRAEKNLIFTSNSRVFYVAKENNGTGNSRVHGFIKYEGNWVTVSPTYSSQVPASSMEQVGGALSYDALNNRLYYVGVKGFLYYYTIFSDWSFNYVVVPKLDLINQNLRIIPNKLAINGRSIYYIGKELSNGNALRVHELIDNFGTWVTNSPTWSAQTNDQPVTSQIQSNGNEIACCPNGMRISYIGSDNKVYYYEKLPNSTWIYSYNQTFGAQNIPATNSLIFPDDLNIYYISTNTQFENGDNKVHNIKLEEAYCQNSSIKIIEPTSTYARMQNQNNSIEAKINNENVVSIFPNPANNLINIKIDDGNIDTQYTFLVRNLLGAKIAEGSLRPFENSISTVNWINGLYIISIFDQKNKLNINKKVLIER